MEGGMSPAGADSSLPPGARRGNAAASASAAAERKLARLLAFLLKKAKDDYYVASHKISELECVKDRHPGVRLTGEALAPLAAALRDSMWPGVLVAAARAWVCLGWHDPDQIEETVEAGIVEAAVQAALRARREGEVLGPLFKALALLSDQCPACLSAVRAAPQPFIDLLLTAASTSGLVIDDRAAAGAFSLLCSLVEGDARSAAAMAYDRRLMSGAVRTVELVHFRLTGEEGPMYSRSSHPGLLLMAKLVAAPEHATAAAAAVTPGLMDAILKELLSDAPGADDGAGAAVAAAGRLRAATIALSTIVSPAGPLGSTGSAGARADVVACAGALPRLLGLACHEDEQVAVSAATACWHIFPENFAPLLQEPSLLIPMITAALSCPDGSSQARRLVLSMYLHCIAADRSGRLLTDLQGRLPALGSAILPHVQSALTLRPPLSVASVDQLEAVQAVLCGQEPRQRPVIAPSPAPQHAQQAQQPQLARQLQPAPQQAKQPQPAPQQAKQPQPAPQQTKQPQSAQHAQHAQQPQQQEQPQQVQDQEQKEQINAAGALWDWLVVFGAAKYLLALFFWPVTFSIILTTLGLKSGAWMLKQLDRWYR